MGWEKRGSALYYYSPARIDGDPRKIDRGNGPAGRAHEIMDRQAARRRNAAWKDGPAVRRMIRTCDQLWIEIGVWLRLLSDSQMLLAGQYRHGGQWRPVRRQPRTGQKHLKSHEPVQLGSLTEQLRRLNEGANARVVGALDELRAFLSRNSSIWRSVEDQNMTVLAMWTTRLTECEALQSLVWNVGRRRAELVGPDALPIEKALTDAVIIAEMSRAYIEYHATINVSTPTEVFLMKHLERADNRVRAATRTLTRIQSALSHQAQNSPAENDLPVSEEENKQTG